MPVSLSINYIFHLTAFPSLQFCTQDIFLTISGLSGLSLFGVQSKEMPFPQVVCPNLSL